MGVCSSLSAAPVFISFGSGREKLTKEQILMVDTYLPDFSIHEQSTELHRQLAAAHWDAVFKEKRNSVTRLSQAYSAATLPVDTDCDTHQRESTGRATSVTTQTGSKIGELFDVFYNYLDEHSPELKPLFRSSLRVKGKVLVHISAGMRSILASEHVADKIAALTKTHLHFGVQLEHFNPLGKALLHAMATVSEDAWTPEVADAWRRLFAHCSAMLMVNQKKMTEAKP